MYGERIRALRKQRKMSRAALGAIFGVSTTAVYKWENNLSEPDISTLSRMADLFGVTIDDLCDYKPAGGADAPESMVARAIRRMTPEEQQAYVRVGKALYAWAFSDEEDEKEPDQDEK